MRYLAVDLGTRRVGLAIGDDETRIATPLEVLQVKGHDAAIAPIQKLADEERVDAIVVGLPLNMDGTHGGAARAVVSWGARLDRKVLFMDERLSSFVAEQQLVEFKRGGGKLTRLDKKRRLDALAAVAILQPLLDGQAQPIIPPRDTDA